MYGFCRACFFCCSKKNFCFPQLERHAAADSAEDGKGTRFIRLRKSGSSILGKSSVKPGIAIWLSAFWNVPLYKYHLSLQNSFFCDTIEMDCSQNAERRDFVGIYD